MRPIGMLYRRGKELSVTVRRFMELLRAGEGSSRGDEVPLNSEPQSSETLSMDKVKTEPLSKKESPLKAEMFAKAKVESNGKPEKTKPAPLAAVGG